MGWSPCKVQLPAGVPERMEQHCSGCTELNPHPLWPRHSEVHPRWKNPRSCSEGRKSWPHHSGGWPWHGKRGMCHCSPGVGPNACDWLGRSPERRFNAEPSPRLVESPKEDWSEDTLRMHASSKEGWLILWNCQNFMIHQKALYLCSMPKGKNKNLLLFIVPKMHWVATLNRCHRDAGHQAVTILCPYCRSTFSGQEWPVRCCNPSGPVCIAYSMRAACLRLPYTLSWPLLLWISYMLILPA